MEAGAPNPRKCLKKDEMAQSVKLVTGGWCVDGCKIDSFTG